MINLFHPPVFEDEDKTLNARLLFTILWTFMLVGWISIFIAIIIPQTTSRWLILIAFMEAGGLLLLVLNRHGWTRLVTNLLILGIWTAATAMCLTGGGTKSNAMSLYLIAVLIAGVLQSGRAGIATAAFCSLTGLFLVFMEQNGSLPASHIHHTSLTLWIAYTAYMAIIIVLQFLVSRTIRESMSKSRRELKSRLLADEAFRESEKKYRTIFNSAIEGIFQSTPAGILLTVNPSLAGMFGYDSPEAMIDSIQDVEEQLYANVEDRRRMKQLLTDGGIVRGLVVEFRRRDGGRFWGSINVREVRDEEGMTLYYEGSVEDITERKKVEEELHQSEATLRSVFKATPVGLCIMKGRVFQNTNKAWYDGFGYSEAEILGHSTRMLYESEEEYERVARGLYEGLSERGLASVQTRLRRKDGVFRDAIVVAAPLKSEDGTQISVVAVQDITEYRQALEELNENRRQLADIVEFLPDATLVVDSEGKIIAWNRAMEAMTGTRAEAMLGKGNHEYALPFYGERRPILIDLVLNPDRGLEAYGGNARKTGDILSGETCVTNLPKGDLYLSQTASALRDSRGEVIAAIECIRDNTERKRMEERLNRAEKMEALGTLAGGVAHDLNNVLGVLVGYSELLAEKLPADSPSRRYANAILQSSERGAAIIQDLLTLARRGVTVSEVVNLNETISGYLRTPEHEKLMSHNGHVTVRTELSKELMNVKGSPVHLGKTVMNLVSNAVEAISGSGTITIRTENRYLDFAIGGYDTLQEGDYVVLSISDTGKGISARDLGKIFEPFYTKKVMGRSGTGLGLAVVWGTMKDHNGYIDVQSEEGAGTTFTLYFPVTREELVPEREKTERGQYMGKGESILVVDDIGFQRELATNLLGSLNYRVASVSSGESALEYVKAQDVDLLLLDMIMDPGIDGYETFKRIRDIRPDQKAIIVSGFAETERVRMAQELGAGQYVRKPYNMETIGIAVRKELDRA